MSFSNTQTFSCNFMTLNQFKTNNYLWHFAFIYEMFVVSSNICPYFISSPSCDNMVQYRTRKEVSFPVPSGNFTLWHMAWNLEPRPHSSTIFKSGLLHFYGSLGLLFGPQVINRKNVFKISKWLDFIYNAHSFVDIQKLWFKKCCLSNRFWYTCVVYK